MDVRSELRALRVAPEDLDGARSSLARRRAARLGNPLATRQMSGVRGAMLLVLVSSCGAPRLPPARDEPPLVIGRSGGGAAAPELGVRFRHPAAAVGSRWRVLLRADSDGTDGDEQTSAYVSEYRVEVVAVDGPAPSRMKVHVDRNVTFFRGAPTPTPVEGKDYVVDVARPHVRDESGSEAPPSEARRVLDWFPDLGTRTRLDEILPDESMRVGERRDELAAEILRIIHPAAWKLDLGHATLARADSVHAELDVTMEATSETGIKMRVAGVAKVRLADSWLVELDLSGSYEAAAGPTGKFELHRAVIAEAAASTGR